MLPITKNELNLLVQYIHGASGISLDSSKAYLLEARLSPILKKNGFPTYLDLCHKAKRDPSKKLEREIIDAISTNETLFFRDKAPFELLKNKILPEIIDARSPQSTSLPPYIKIWSAASSTGQELYSIAITIRELLGTSSKYRFHLLGTDISNNAVSQASYGKYNKFEVDRGLDINQRNKYFVSDGDSWKIKDEIRAMVKFQKFNLMQPLTSLGKFDIIFCRNVAIYFSAEDRRKLFAKLEMSLADDGFLVIGSTESLSGIADQFIPKRHMRSIFYEKAGKAKI
ncbi:CheR family methyltransferase [Desulfotalea psychrophila]|uniref:protein-glutamate O-methyltransferase n=1 Tax=Desulfotalea psychrophila (strain LSv54 / DSM 12343) TaxID=177439 RepID=Q6AJV2_DESPS|nr:protein-glutamate O-methyltransferase CheR [Desulfotalea psychrophila]CAG37374.1 related to chemotaxis protein methyltransferase CheR [Desulfotalea psychrophila LSv54]